MHYLLPIMLWLPSLVIAHPFHVSICEITYKGEDKYVEITHKIFLDDLENTLNQKYGKRIYLSDPAIQETLDSLLIAYLRENFSLIIDGQKVMPHYLGKEIQADAMWCYLEVEHVGTFSEVTVSNTILLESFEDQTNLVHVNKADQLKSLRLYEDKKQGTLRFK